MQGLKQLFVSEGNRWFEEAKKLAKIKLSILGLSNVTAAGSVYANRAVGIDISHYQATIDWSQFDGDFVLIKGGEGVTEDPMCATHVQNAYDEREKRIKAGEIDRVFAIGIYFFIDTSYYLIKGYPLNDIDRWPGADTDPNLLMMYRVLSTKAWDFVAVDIERWWVDYAEYLEFLRGTRAIENVKTIPNAWISKSAKIVSERLQDWVYKNWPKQTRKVRNYTGKWFVDAFAPDMNAWMAKFLLWIGWYPYGSGTVSIANLKAYKDKYLPADNITPPTLACSDYDLWQTSGDKFVVLWVLGGMGKPSAIDINLSRFDRAGFFQSIEYTLPVVTPPPVDPSPDNPPPPTTTDCDLTDVKADLATIKSEVNRIGSHFK